MSRRDLLGTAAVAIAGTAAGAHATAAGTATTSAGLSGNQSSGNGRAGHRNARATTLQANQDSPFELSELTIADLQDQMGSGALSSERILGLYLERIEDIDRGAAKLRSILEINPDALEIARELDRERAAGNVRGPMHGIPVLLKDNIDTADQMTTTAGSLALEGSRAPRDSTVAANLRAAGAVLLGKANLSEWANFRSNESSSGWSGRGGQCRNPYALDRNPCGSSSGSGAATSANLTSVAIGTETNGSIVCPSSANGLVGIKPTVGLVSRAGIIPISAAQDTAGPMARTVTDAATLLTAIAGADPRDALSTEKQPGLDYTTGLNAAELRGKRIGIMEGVRGRNEYADLLLDEAKEALESAGATVLEDEGIEFDQNMGQKSYEAMLYEFKDGLRKYFATLGPQAPVKSLADVIAFNEEHQGRELHYFDQDIMLLAETKGSLDDPEYKDARKESTQLARAGIDKACKRLKLDAIMGPTGGPAWVTDLVGGDHFTGVGSSSPAAISGYPNITVPGGHAFGLPMGVSFFGPAWTEPRLIAIAYAFEQATKHRTAPTLRPTIDLTEPL